MRKILYIALIFLLCGCGGVGSYNEFQAEITKCEFIQHKDSDSFVYTFKNTQTGDIITATANEHFYNVGDIVKVFIQDNMVSSMKLIKQSPENITTNDQIKIDTKRKSSKKNKDIPIPKAENINF